MDAKTSKWRRGGVVYKRDVEYVSAANDTLERLALT